MVVKTNDGDLPFSGFIKMIKKESANVVGIFGKQRRSTCQSYVSKNDILNNFMQNDVFPIDRSEKVKLGDIL